ncbi:MAG: hypothetical protein M1820_006865 [Bogoriella megaspora]|nr:MAG: hypothetical protein M1820_006865 [Bogoriella megaspora]
MQLSQRIPRFSLRVVLSYLLDWVIIAVIAGIGGAFNSIEPYHRPFSLLDLSISFPLKDDTVSVTTLVLVSVIAPGILIFLLSILLVPGPAAIHRLSRSQLLHRKLWEWNTGWMGLGLSLASAFFITQGMKNLFGVPRPHLLSVCQPDLSRIAPSVIGGFGQDISERWTLVTSDICTTTDLKELKDSFRSFPSGHSSTSWSGLLYLSLWFCAKFGVRFPTLPSRFQPAPILRPASPEALPVHQQDTELHAEPTASEYSAAAAPIPLLALSFIPIATAIYICSTRYTDFYHHAFDILFGSLIGVSTSVMAFRWYQMPLIDANEGWAWGPRTRTSAFGTGVGTAGYVDLGNWGSSALGGKAVVKEMGNVAERGDSAVGEGSSRADTMYGRVADDER